MNHTQPSLFTSMIDHHWLSWLTIIINLINPLLTLIIHKNSIHAAYQPLLTSGLLGPLQSAASSRCCTCLRPEKMPGSATKSSGFWPTMTYPYFICIRMYTYINLFSSVHLRFPDGFPMVAIGFHHAPYGFPMDFLWISYVFPMDFQWISYGFYHVHLWISPMDSPIFGDLSVLVSSPSGAEAQSFSPRAALAPHPAAVKPLLQDAISTMNKLVKLGKTSQL